MDESTTTPGTDNAGVDATTQPVDGGENQVAENQPDEQTTDQLNESNEAVADENLAWLTNKGVDPASPDALAKVAEMYRNAETQLRSTRNDVKLNTVLDQPNAASEQLAQDPNGALMLEVQNLKTARAVDTFFAANPDAKQYEAAMTDLVSSDPNMLYMVQNGFMGIDKLYQMARGADSSRDTTMRTEGGREALQKVADKQQAKAVTGAATSSAMSSSQVTKQNFDEWYGGLSAAERAKPENQEIVASLLSN